MIEKSDLYNGLIKKDKTNVVEKIDKLFQQRLQERIEKMVWDHYHSIEEELKDQMEFFKECDDKQSK